MTDSGSKRKGGRPPFEPTAEQRRTVHAMVAYGIPLTEIQKVIGIDRKTLSKHFKQEIATAATEANAKVAQALYRQAVDNGNTTAQIFWLKTKAGWRETSRHELTGPDGGPISGSVHVRFGDDPKATDEDESADD
jgi:hypothetical protein